MSEKKNDNQKQLNIAIDESVANGIYSNLAIVCDLVAIFAKDPLSIYYA